MSLPGGLGTSLARAAASRDRAGLRRSLRPRGADDDVLDLAGNDYLGLARDATVLDAAAQALRRYGLGATGSRLVRGSTDTHTDLEDDLAAWLGTSTALLYSSGYLANLGAVRALTVPGTTLVVDAHAHASLVDGCRIAGVDRRTAETVVVPHADVAAVEAALAERPGRPAVVVTESVFSVDGDLAPLRPLHAACRAAGAVLLVDEAHALGVVGPGGSGAAAAQGLTGEPDVVVTATLSKAFGALGGVVAGPSQLRAHLVDTSRTFVYDTALPPAVVAGAGAALAILRDGDGLREELRRRVRYAVDLLRADGLTVPEPAGGVISVAVDDAPTAVRWAQECSSRGVAVGCFRPPSTPDRRSRLRLTVSLGLSSAQFEHAVAVVAAARPRGGAG